jgi:hypothetical protein
MRREWARNFVGKHPLFRKTHSDNGVPWQQNIYYLWWEYLRRHEGYRKTCEKGGKGAYAKLYADFGNIHDCDFKTWWRANGVRLFAEPPSPVGVWALSNEETLELIEQGRDDNTLIVAIPLDYKRRSIMQGINKILTESQTRKRGEKRIKTSKALYPLAQAFDVMALKVTLECYDLRKANPDMTLWQIAQKAGVSDRLTAAELASNDATAKDKKYSMTAGVSRKLRNAAAIIDNVGRGVFAKAG